MSSEIIDSILENSKYGYVREYQFDKNYGKRLFRADFAIPSHGILIEYEGLSFAKNSTSRHQTNLGISKDTEKYNIAVKLGFSVLRYTVLTLKNNPYIVLDDIDILVKNIENRDPIGFCYKCNEPLWVNKKLLISTNNGYHCLVCQWIIDDLKKK